MNYKPSGYPSISPYLVVEDGQRLIDFLEEVFDGRVARRYERPDGSLKHAEVRIDDSIIMIGETVGEWRATPSMIHLYHPDVDAVFERALAAGAVVQQEPAIGTDGDTDKRGGFLGPCGNSWWVSTQTD